MVASWELRKQHNTLVGILHTENVTFNWAQGLRRLIIPGPPPLGVCGMPYDHARNELCKALLASNLEWLFQLDSDVIPPADAILRLIRHGRPIISGVYARRSVPESIPVMLRDRQWLHTIPTKGLIDVHLVGAGCLLPDTEVLTNFAPVEAKHIGKDRVLTAKGRYRRVVASKTRKYAGSVIGMSAYSYRDPVWVTPEHPVFIIPREWVHWCKPDSPLAPSLIEQFGKFVPAGQIRKGDCLATPIYQDVNDIEFILLSDHLPDSENVEVESGHVYYKTGRNPTTGELVKYRNRIDVTEDFLEFCGFYLAEGSAGKQLDIHLGTHEKDLIERVSELAAKCFGVQTTVRVRDGSTSVRIGGRALAQFFGENFGTSSETKKIPQWIMALPPKKQQGLLRGAVLGDGCCVYGKKGGGGVWINYATVSKTLARQIQQLYLRSGYIPAVKSVPPSPNGRRIVTKNGTRCIQGKFPVWHVNLYGKNSWLFAKSVLGETYPLANHGKWQKSFIVGNTLYSAATPVRKKYTGEVYDFQVADDSTYVAGNFLVHNCLLIHRSVLQAFLDRGIGAPGKPWFHWKVDMAGICPPEECLSEDFSFNYLARTRLKVPIVVDCEVVCKHVGLAEAKPGYFRPVGATPDP